MKLTQEQLRGLDSVINEANLGYFDFDGMSRVRIAFDVWTYDESDRWPADTWRLFTFQPVGRIAASLRAGHWDDRTAQVERLSVQQLPTVVQDFGGLSVYGAQFFDRHEEKLSRWGDRLSLDFHQTYGARSHSIALFQAASNRHLDFCIWFDDLEIQDITGRVYAIEELIAGMARWNAAVMRREEAAMAKRRKDGTPYAWLAPLRTPEDMKRAKRVISTFTASGRLPESLLSRLRRSLLRLRGKPR